MSARILVLDESRVLPWVVARVCPPGTVVVALTSLDDAARALRESPPDAAVVSVTPAHVVWREFQHLCAVGRPPVPVLYVSCLFTCAADAGLEPLEGEAAFLRKPASKAEFAEALRRLLRTVDGMRDAEPAGEIPQGRVI
jgi:hypothetical protein